MVVGHGQWLVDRVPRCLETGNFPKMFADNFYENCYKNWQGFKLMALLHYFQTPHLGRYFCLHVWKELTTELLSLLQLSWSEIIAMDVLSISFKVFTWWRTLFLEYWRSSDHLKEKCLVLLPVFFSAVKGDYSRVPNKRGGRGEGGWKFLQKLIIGGGGLEQLGGGGKKWHNFFLVPM